jgi:hypothetical protein
MSGPVVPRPLATSILTGLPSSSTEVQLAHVNGTLAPTAASTSSQLPPPHYPAHFMKGSVIQLANGELKRVEDLTTEDFIRSAEASSDLCLDSSIVVSLSPLSDRGTVMIEFSIGPQNLQVSSHYYCVLFCFVVLCIHSTKLDKAFWFIFCVIILLFINNVGTYSRFKTEKNVMTVNVIMPQIELWLMQQNTQFQMHEHYSLNGCT